MDNKVLSQENKQENTEKILIITGMSGAGKSRTIGALEDIGYYCVDNLPPSMFAQLIADRRRAERLPAKIALVADIRGGVDSLSIILAALADIKELGIDYQLVFLEAEDAVLVRRYKETRRPHPLAADGRSILASIQEERRILSELRGYADIVIDTTDLINQSLTRHISELFGGNFTAGPVISVVSFGFKYGLPIDADLVIDVRFITNPYYIPELKPLTGLDEKVKSFVLEDNITKEFMRRYMRLIRFLLPQYFSEGKKHVSLAVGCTGGRHRSVALAVAISKKLKGYGYTVNLSHRDIDRASK
ncbi:MAG: RNase adapter RapZ [Clostridiales bacterium]